MPDRYTVYTLVDITDSKVTNPYSNDVSGYNQHQNLNTLIQCIGMRSQPMDFKVTVLQAQDIVDYDFGSQFTGQHTVWKFEFTSEHTDVFTKDDDPVYHLKSDCNDIVFTPYLNETANFLSNTFNSIDENALNIYFLKYE